MTITKTATDTNAQSSSNSQLVTRTVASGNLCVLAIGIRSISVIVNTISDSTAGSNTWTKIHNEQVSGVTGSVEIWASVLAAGITTVTCNISGSITVSMDVSDYTTTVGWDATFANTVKNQAANTTATTAPAQVPVTTTVANALVLCAMTTAGSTTSATLTAGSGGSASFTSLNFGSGGSGGNSFSQARAYRIVTATGAYGPVWTTPSATDTIATVAFQEQAPVVSAPVRRAGKRVY